MALPKKKGRRSSQIGRLGLECSFLKYDDADHHITYTVQLKCQANETAWNVTKRYNEFHRLNNELQKDKNFRGIKLPNFPGKAISFTDRSKKELADERMQHLEIYLNGLISRTVFLSSLAVRAFLSMPVPVRDLAVILSTRQNAALKQGYMDKKGELNKKWRRRWFVLQPNYILKYYKEEASNEPQGSIDISTIIQVQMKNTTQSDNSKQFSFTLVGKDRRWFLACENETEKREWTRMFMRLRDTKAPVLKGDKSSGSSKDVLQKDHPKALNIGMHFKTVTQVRWCPTIPGILATGSEDESVKIWQTHLLDHTLVPAEYDNEELDKILKADQNDENEAETDENDSKEKEKDEKKKDSTYPLHAIEFQPIAEYKTSGQVTCLEWSPDGSMLVVSLRKQMKDGANKFGYFIQCFDLHPILQPYTTDWDDFGGDNNEYDFDAADAHNHDGSDDEDESRTKIFTLQDHPSRLVFSSDGSQIYMAMDIDPNSEENEARRPAFLVYLDLGQNQLHRCIDRNETRIVERNGARISSLLFTDDDSWLIVGRDSGQLEFWNVYNENNKKLQSYYKQQNSEKDNKDTDKETEEEVEDEQDQSVNISLFEQKFVETIHSGPVFHLTTSNGVLISSAKPTSLEYESFFTDNVVWDIRLLMNFGKQSRMVARLHNLNDSEKDITRLLDLSPVTPRHVREGGGPGTLLAASGDHAVYCHNMMDVFLDAMSMGNLQQ